MSLTCVTGATGPLGKKICFALAKRGVPLLLHYKSNDAAGKELAKMCGADLVQFDFSQDCDPFCQELVDRGVDRIVHTVGPYLIKGPSETSPQQWKEQLQLNFHTPVDLITNLLPSLSSFLALGVSGLEKERANTYCTAYWTAKKSLLMALKAFAKEFPDKQFNMVSPGHMEHSVDCNKTPVKAEDVAELIAYLLSEHALSITGQNIEIARGFAL